MQATRDSPLMTESKRRNSFVNHGHDHSDSCVQCVCIMPDHKITLSWPLQLAGLCARGRARVLVRPTTARVTRRTRATRMRRPSRYRDDLLSSWALCRNGTLWRCLHHQLDLCGRSVPVGPDRCRRCDHPISHGSSLGNSDAGRARGGKQR
jgi:hypothetical protein